MARLNHVVKNELIQEIKRGVSINKISSSLRLAKSTIYHHYKKIKGRRNKVLFFKPKATEIEGEIVGIFAGDGSQYFEPKRVKYEVSVHFGYKNKNYALYVRKLFESYFDKKFQFRREKYNKIILKTSSKDIYFYFQVLLAI